MKLNTLLSKIDRLQHLRGFKITASALVLAAILTYIGFSVVGSTTTSQTLPESEVPEMLQDQDGNIVPNPIARRDKQLRAILDVSQSPVNGILSVTLIGVFVAIVIWLGLGLTYVGTMTIVGLIGWPLYSLGSGLWSSIGFFLIGTTLLMLSFTVLLRGIRLLLSGSHPIPTIARNVLAEAVRMRISIVFILLLASMLAVMPMMLDTDQPLRYRVQGFLQWSTTASFWLIALLVVFFSAATVSYEQREKVIWQTMTKPVASWQYVIGKWLGVTLLSGTLLAVAGLGIFQFTQYLRSQTAVGEVAPYEAKEGRLLAEDRLILETQVLTARKLVNPYLPFYAYDSEFDSAVEAEVAQERLLQTDYNPTPAELHRIRMKLFNEAVSDYRSIDPIYEGYAHFSFKELEQAKRLGKPMVLRYKINAEGNRPDKFYALTFVFEDGTMIPRKQTGLGFSHTFTVDAGFINNKGELNVQIYNGEVGYDNSGNMVLKPNSGTMTIPPDGFELSYQVGTFRGNFSRIMVVLWVKLALLSMIAVWASCFASFPVACLVSITVFLMGESAGFVQQALPAWAMGTDSVVGILRTGIFHFADTVSKFFGVYYELKPTKRLAEGEALGWGQVSTGVTALSIATGVFYVFAVHIFRRRQLAMYSGG